MRKKSYIIFLTVFLTATTDAQYFLTTILEVNGTPGSGMLLGTGILGLGDINNDGKPDFAVSAHGVGKTFIYFGGQGVLDDIPDVTLRGGDNMVMGDLNGDGLKDLIIHQGVYSNEMVDSIFVYYGKVPSPLAIDTIPGLIFAGEHINDEFGRSMDMGDLNDDGFDDLVIGAPQYLHTGKGIVYVFLGKTQPTNAPDYREVGEDFSTFFGFGVKIGRINGDEIPDLLISSDTREPTNGNVFIGTVDIYSGKPGWVFQKEERSQRLEATKVETLNLPWFNLLDMNNDGQMDIVCPSDRLINTLVFYGGADSISWTPSFIIPCPDTSQYRLFPYPVDIGDVNMDGTHDYVITAPVNGAPGTCIFVYLGALKNPIPKEVGIRCKGFVGNRAFWNVAGVGDLNGDGVNDFGATVPADYAGSSTDGYFVILSGNRSFTGVEDEASIPEQPTLSQNYPNPFNPQTTIEFALTKREHVLLIVYDSLGKEVKQLVNGEMNAGSHKVVWDGINKEGWKVASGTYYYRIIRDGKNIEAKHLIFLK